MKLKLQDIFTFGKYKGKTVAEIYEIDKQYLIWVAKNKIKNIEFDGGILNPFDFGFEGFKRVTSNKVTKQDSFYEYTDKDCSYHNYDCGEYYPTGCDIYNFG